MSVESSFLKDRPATKEELKDLPDGVPDVTGTRQYEDLYKVSAAESVVTINESCSLKNWFFRTN